MGRGNNAPAPPSYSTSEIRYGNQVVGKTYVDPKTGSIVNQYFPDPAEVQRQKIAQQKINDITLTLGQTAPELATQYNNTENSFIQNATNQFMNQYNPAVRALQNDIASRFGTLNSSQFLDDLGQLEKNKASALADIVNRGESIKYDLVNQNEANKLREIQSLGGLLNSTQSNFLGSLQAPLSASSSLNDFLNSQWMTQLNNYTQDLVNKRSLEASMANNQGLKGYISSVLFG